MRLLVTRPEADQDQTLKALDAMGITGVSAPVMAVSFFSIDIPDCPEIGGLWQGLLVTSRNGLRALSREQIGQVRDWPFYCVGSKTAQLAEHLGLVDIRAVYPTAEACADDLAGQLNPVHGTLLYLSGRHRSGQIMQILEERGLPCQLVEAYETRALAHFSHEVREEMKSGHIDGILLYSRRSADIFLSLMEKDHLENEMQGLVFYCLSAAVAEPLKERGYSFVVANAPNEASLLACAKKGHNYLR